MAGYSGTPLAKKLGIKNNATVMLLRQPDNYFHLFTDVPAAVYFVNEAALKKDVIYFFTNQCDEFLTTLPMLMQQMKPDGMIWVSRPKKASKVASKTTEDLIRNFALKIGLVDIKVCVVDEIWSGLKLVIPVKNRALFM